MEICSSYSSGQGKIAPLLFSAALQTSLTACMCHCNYKNGDLLFIQVHSHMLGRLTIQQSKGKEKQQGWGFIRKVLGLVELQTMRHAVVGRPGEDGLSVEQRKRLTIAVELVANPSIVFIYEPTSGQSSLS
ncbi:TPA: hypothetical protein ACH3X2_004779 [Trebouxia sp. C0005]